MVSKDILIRDTESIKQAYKQLDKSAEKVLLVVDDSRKFLGTITDGDIRRYVLKGRSLNGSIKNVYNKRPIKIEQKDFSIDMAKELLIKKSIDLIPILDSSGHPVDSISWGTAFSDEKRRDVKTHSLKAAVVIMAGGRGKRLEPFSRIFPKPLIPIGEKPIVEIIIDEFQKHGIGTFYLTLGYKGKMIESYFDSIDKDVKISYSWDKDTPGTASSLKLLEKRLGSVFIVSNCDVIVRADFKEVIELHKREDAMLTVLSSVQHHRIPHGIVKIKKKGQISGIIEKPEYSFMINTGVYVLSKKALKYIPKRSQFDMTDLITTLLSHNHKVLTYPVNESDYIDIGQWEEYKKSFHELSLL